MKAAADYHGYKLGFQSHTAQVCILAPWFSLGESSLCTSLLSSVEKQYFTIRPLVRIKWVNTFVKHLKQSLAQ